MKIKTFFKSLIFLIFGFIIIYFIFKNQDLKLLDACAAPGGKAFQLLSKNLNVTLNDKSKRRIQILKSNLNRLKFNPTILNRDFINFDKNEKFDFRRSIRT